MSRWNRFKQWLLEPFYPDDWNRLKKLLRNVWHKLDALIERTRI